MSWVFAVNLLSMGGRVVGQVTVLDRMPGAAVSMSQAASVPLPRSDDAQTEPRGTGAAITAPLMLQGQLDISSPCCSEYVENMYRG